MRRITACANNSNLSFNGKLWELKWRSSLQTNCDCLMSISRKIRNILQLPAVSIQLVADTIIDFKNEHSVNGSRLLSFFELGVLLSKIGYFVKVMLLSKHQHSKNSSKNTWNSNSHLTVSYLATSGIEIFLGIVIKRKQRGKQILKLPQWLSVIIQARIITVLCSVGTPKNHKYLAKYNNKQRCAVFVMKSDCQIGLLFSVF